MNLIHRAIFLPIILVLMSCSTGAYLKPEAPAGTYSTENPACPGAQEVIEFRPTGENWIIFRVLAKLPNKYSPEGTKLIAYFRVIYGMPESRRSTWSAMFPNEEQQKEQSKLIERRQSQEIIITSSRPLATIVLPDGSKSQVALPFFEKPYNPKEAENPYNIWGPEVVISPNRLEEFTVLFPDIYFNGKKLDIPPVKFGIGKGTYAPVLNC